MNTISERLQYLLDLKNITVYTLCQDTGLNNTTVGRIINQGTKPQRSTAETICEYFKVNIDWFFTGKGKMLKTPKRDTGVANLVEDPVENYGNNKFIPLDSGQKIMLVPYVDQPAQAGFISGYNDNEFLEYLPYHPILVDSYHKGVYYAFKVVGDSMDDGSKNSIEENSIVTGRVIDKSLWRSKFHIHKFKNYIIVHNEGILVKEIIEHDTNNGTIKIHSLNNLYNDDVLSLDDCLMILNVVDINKKP